MDTRNSTAAGTLLGVPVGELGWFASWLMGTALGFAGFFAATFVGIISLLFFNTLGHHAVDYSYAYKRFGLPVGLVVLVVAYAGLGWMWAKKVLRRSLKAE